MSVTEIKATIDSCTHEERLYMLAYLQHVERSSQSEYKEHLAVRAGELENGKGIPVSQVDVLHKQLKASGL